MPAEDSCTTAEARSRRPARTAACFGSRLFLGRQLRESLLALERLGQTLADYCVAMSLGGLPLYKIAPNKRCRVAPIQKEETMRNVLLRLVAFAVVLVFPAGVFARDMGQTDTRKPVPKKAGQERAAGPMKFVATDEAPKAIGPYSQAVVEGGYLFASGQIPLDPKTGELARRHDRAVRGTGLRQPGSRSDSRRAVLRGRCQDDRLPHEGRGLRGDERDLRPPDG